MPSPGDDAQPATAAEAATASHTSILLQWRPESKRSPLQTLKAGATPIERALAANGVNPEQSSLAAAARKIMEGRGPGTGPAPAEPKPAAPIDTPQPFPPLPGSPAGASSGAVGGGVAGSTTVVAALTAVVLVITLELWLAVAISSGAPAGVRRRLLLDRPG
jgi:hypothetical protein